jgi:hypothetical protein
MRKRLLDLSWPTGGLDKSSAFRRQPPYTTPDANNVRPFETLTGRVRGGSRPGIGKHVYAQLGSGAKVNMLANVTYVSSDKRDYWTDEFEGTAMGDMWAAISGGTLPSVLGEFAQVSYGTTVSAIRDALTFDTTAAHYLELYIVPWDGEWHGDYVLYFGLNDTTPVPTTAGYVLTLTQTGATGTYSGTLKRYSGSALITTWTLTGGTLSALEGGWLSVLITPATPNVKVYWQGTALLDQNVTAFAGNRFGFGMNPTVAGGICLADAFRVQYYHSGQFTARKQLLVAAANGSLYYETWKDQLALLSTNLTIASDRNIQAVERGQKLYIADWAEPRYVSTSTTAGTLSSSVLDDTNVTSWNALGIDPHDDVVVISSGAGGTTDGTYQITSVHDTNGVTLATNPGNGTCAYRIERAPKVFDPSAGTLAIWAATALKGQVPTGCPLISRYRDRIALAGALVAPHVWYQSRLGDPDDWDYSQTDVARAVAGTTAEAGRVGEPITAQIAHSDEYLVYGCPQSVWVMAGDAAYGGKLNAASQNVGIIDAGAYARGPQGELYFLSSSGLYVLPSGSSQPQEISRNPLPRDLQFIDANSHTILLAYDHRARGIHIYLTPDESKTIKHWWFDLPTKSLWPLTMVGNHEPFSLLAYNTETNEGYVVLLGTRNGYVRRYRETFETDEGTAITSYVVIGPIPGGNELSEGVLSELECTKAEDCGEIDWSILAGDSGEAVLSATASQTGTFARDGIQYTVRPRVRGKALAIKLANGESRRWALETLAITMLEAGRKRLA